MWCVLVSPSSPPSVTVCTSGFVSDGNGNCVASSVPIFCASGFHSDGNGNCIPSSSPLP